MEQKTEVVGQNTKELQLHDAVVRLDVDRVSRLVEEGADVNYSVAGSPRFCHGYLYNGIAPLERLYWMHDQQKAEQIADILIIKGAKITRLALQAAYESSSERQGFFHLVKWMFRPNQFDSSWHDWYVDWMHQGLCDLDMGFLKGLKELGANFNKPLGVVGQFRSNRESIESNQILLFWAIKKIDKKNQVLLRQI